MKRPPLNRVVIAIIAICVIAGGAYAVLGTKGEDKAKSDANTTTVTRGTIEAVVTAQGKLEPKDYVDVGAEVSGQVKKLHVQIGSIVKTGDLIAEIDPATYQAAVKGDQAQIKQLEAQILQQDATYKQAEQKLARNKTLFDSKAVSEEVFQDAQTAMDVAEAQTMALAAQLDEAKSVLEGDEADLERTKIYAPMEGTVVSLPVKEGQTLNANQSAPVIGQVARLDIMTVRAQVAEADVSKLSPNMEMYFTTLGSQGRKWKGHVRQILPSPQTVNDVVLYDVLSDVDNKDGALMTGMTTQMFFVLGRAKDVLVIPSSVLMKRVPESDTQTAKAYEVRVAAGREPVTKIVLIGLSDRTSAQIISGLSEGERVMLPASTAPANAQQQGAARARSMGPRL
jgi:macrolide-specific efflux system membrane fusion protein